MTELHLALSVEAMQALAHGEELVIDTPDRDVRVVLCCTDACVNTIKTQVERALLRHLPADESIH